MGEYAIAWLSIHHLSGTGTGGRYRRLVLLLSDVQSLDRPGLATTRARSTPVGDRGLGRLHARYAAHPAAGVRGATRVVQAGDRGAVVGVAGGGAQVEQLLQGELAVED